MILSALLILSSSSHQVKTCLINSSSFHQGCLASISTQVSPRPSLRVRVYKSGLILRVSPQPPSLVRSFDVLDLLICGRDSRSDRQGTSTSVRGSCIFSGVYIGKVKAISPRKIKYDSSRRASGRTATSTASYLKDTVPDNATCIGVSPIIKRSQEELTARGIEQ